MASHSEDTSVEKKLKDCQQALHYRFRDQGLLELCLTHASVAKTRLSSNERLEFLGDAILGAIVCEMLYHRFPEDPEGELTRIKSVLVSRNTCATISEELGLEKLLLLGKGLSMYEKVPLSVSAAVFESLVAGIFLDGGMEAARAFLEPLIDVEIERVSELHHMKNFKSLLQQVSQKHFGETPVYLLLDEKGPDHSKCFKITAVIGSQTYPAAWGPNKKEAEQRAARNALCEIEGTDSPNISE